MMNRLMIEAAIDSVRVLVQIAETRGDRPAVRRLNARLKELTLKLYQAWRNEMPSNNVGYEE